MTPYETSTVAADLRKVRVLVNRRSGARWSFEAVRHAIDTHWDTPGRQLTWQFCRDAADGRQKAAQAVADGCDLLMVVGGDGTVNSAGSVLMGTSAALGVIPIGSGNGFARHFEVPLKPEDAARALAGGHVRRIDVGTYNGRPFLVSCSMAWDATIVRSFEKSPIRGVLPYIFAGAYEFLGYDPQPVMLELDGDEILTYSDPLVLTVANLTQYGGGAVICPTAEPDDGHLELIVARRQDIGLLLGNIHRLIGGSLSALPRVVYRQFRHLTVEREKPAAVQADGELIDAPADIEVTVKEKVLNVLVPGPDGKNG